MVYPLRGQHDLPHGTLQRVGQSQQRSLTIHAQVSVVPEYEYHRFDNADNNVNRSHTIQWPVLQSEAPLIVAHQARVVAILGLLLRTALKLRMSSASLLEDVHSTEDSFACQDDHG